MTSGLQPDLPAGMKMKLCLEKLANAWQLRFVTIAGCMALVIYAVVMPVHSTESVNLPVNLPSPATPMDTAVSGKGLPLGSSQFQNHTDSAVDSSNSLRHSTSSPSRYWVIENPAAAALLERTATLYQDQELPRDASDLIRELRRSAASGDATAEFLLGEAYQQGLGVPRSLSENLRWYAEAAHAGAAQPTTASNQTPRSYAQALLAYRQAADSGEKTAELYLGLANDLGNGMPIDSAQAANWYRKAAAQGSTSAACNLGELYLYGRGVPKDSVEAAHWLERAAARGSAVAQYALGQMYRDGKGVAQDDVIAAQWLEDAAKRGNAPAQVTLSSMYASGNGVAGSTAKAYMWINLAAARDARLRDSRAGLEKNMSPVEMAEGQRLTHSWLSTHVSKPVE